MNTNLLHRILSVQSESYNQFRMFAFLVRHLKAANVHYYVDNGNIYVSKGSGMRPCIVAHMDTVHEITDEIYVLKCGERWTGFNRYSMTQTGIGGDDKVGIFIALELLAIHDNVKLVFFRDEEVGCLGSSVPDIDFFSDCSFVLQADRRGNSDFIVEASGVPLSSDSFQNDVLSAVCRYGYKFNNGAMTDVMALKKAGIDISMANISCGYYNPHQRNEYISLRDVNNCLRLMDDICRELGGTRYEHRYAPIHYGIHDFGLLYGHDKETYQLCTDCYARYSFDATGLCSLCKTDYEQFYQMKF